MTVLDAFALLALLKGEPAANEVAAILRTGDGVLTVVGVAEVVDHLVRVAGQDDDEVALDLAQLGLLDAPALDAATAFAAGAARARHYHRRNRAVSLADCLAAETARSAGAPVATADPHLLDLCRAEGIAVVALPDSQGRTWRG